MYFELKLYHCTSAHRLELTYANIDLRQCWNWSELWYIQLYYCLGSQKEDQEIISDCVLEIQYIACRKLFCYVYEL